MLFDQTALSIIFPVMTFIFFDTHSRLFAENTSVAVRSMWYGICISLPHLINMVVTPCLSALSDRFGRKKILLLATFGAVLVTLIGALSVLWGLLSFFVMGCIIQGIFSRTDPVAIAAVGDIASREDKVLFMGYVQTAISIGAFVGPMLGGFFATRFLFQTFNFALPFFIASLFAVTGLLITAFSMKETLEEKNSIRLFANMSEIKKIFADPFILRLTLLLLLSQFSWRIYYQYIPPILKTQFGFNAHELGLFVGLIAFWLSLATAFGIRLLRKFYDLSKILLLSIYSVFFGLVMTIGFCFLHDSFSLFMICVAVIPIAMGDVIAFSCITAMYSDAVRKQDQGKVMGICFIVVALMWALTGFLGGFLMSIHPYLPLVVAPVGVVISIVMMKRQSKLLTNFI